MKKNFFSHKTSCIDKGAKIGKGTKVWHFSHIMSGAAIGENCNIGQNVVIHGRVTIGNNVKVQNNVSIYDGVVLKNYVFCGPSVVFTNVSRPRSALPKEPLKDYENTIVKEGATIGANSTILCGHVLGRYCFVGAGSIVIKDIPDYALVYGNPAKIRGWICECGQNIKIKASAKAFSCRNCGKVYSKVSRILKKIKD